MSEKYLLVSAAPHIRTPEDIPKIMYAVLIALIPVVIASVYFFSLLAVKLIVVCIITAVFSEYIFQKLRKKNTTALDGSAMITGLLLALTLPPNLPLWAAALGVVFAIVLGKQIFGGLGYNIFNPALLGRAFLMAAFPALMTSWTLPFNLDAVTGATPLAQMKFAQSLVAHQALFLGNISGSLGETSALAILIGAVFLLLKKIIDWRIPAGFMGTVVLLSGAFWLINPEKFADPLWHLLAGGLILGAFFMATDMVSSPVTRKGKWIFAVGCGVILMLIRFWGGLPEGVMYSILLMNALVPLIDRFVLPVRFGGKRKNSV
ncbi:MAG: RnfABCDGE type electron transport complex subunit D [Omnitrophica bacterium]|nr:RnfABCDGE type electron transport complex subunit D [Candidatus Omnitrophota bacterium]